MTITAVSLNEVLKEVRYRAMTRKPIYQVHDEWSAREQAFEDIMLVCQMLEYSADALADHDKLTARVEELKDELYDARDDVRYYREQLDAVENERDNADRDHSPCVCDRDSW
jgi:chromosome segregation ATPase